MATGWQDVGMSEAGTLAHRLRRMSGRDPDEHGRASTPLELLFDLTFVVAVGIEHIDDIIADLEQSLAAV